MDIEGWFESMPSHIVNEIAQEKRYIWYAIHDAKALSFKIQDYIIKDILTMSRKVKHARNQESAPVVTERGASKSGGNGNGKTRWANCDVRNQKDKSAVRELASNVNFVLDTLVELIDDGYDLHIKRTDQGASVRSMLFCHIDGSPNKNGGLSAEAPDAWLSVTALIYKHVHKLDGRWFDSADEPDEDDAWR